MEREPYRVGPVTPDENCPLDVMAAAQAARLAGERFCFGPARQFPALSRGNARQCLDDLAREESPALKDHPMDLLRDVGQLGSLADRVLDLAARPSAADEIMAWREPMAKPAVSLRWETLHISDAPAGYRAQGSKPVTRLSHPGRNLLAALTVAQMFPPEVWLDLPYDCYPMPRPFTVGRRWWAPHQPVTYESWRAMMLSGPEPSNAPALAAEWDDRGTWWVAHVGQRQRYFMVDAPTERRWSTEYRAARERMGYDRWRDM